MLACDAAVRSRARENSPGTRVRGGEQGVRLFSSFSPLTFRVPHPADDRASILFFSLPLSHFFFQLVERLRSVVRAWTCLSLTSQGFGTQQPWQPQQQPPSKPYKRKDDNNYY
jgi:hypothetical protein